MRLTICSLFFVTAILTVFGCSRTPSDKPGTETPSSAEKRRDDAAAIRSNLAKLIPEDRKLAEEQQYCAVETENQLGSMGVPYKVMINEQPVFLCCDGCETRAKAHADRTLAKVQQLRDKAKKPAM